VGTCVARAARATCLAAGRAFGPRSASLSARICMGGRRAAIASAAEMLTAEAATHEDLVVVRGADAYRNLPNKTVRLLRYMLSSARGRAPRRPPGPSGWARAAFKPKAYSNHSASASPLRRQRMLLPGAAARLSVPAQAPGCCIN